MDALEIVAELMAIAARTAPKGAGQDYIVTRILKGEECLRLGDGMIAYGQRSGKVNWDRDGENVKASPVVVLIGLKDAQAVGIDCGACGQERCLAQDQVNAYSGEEFAGPQCAIRVIDLGIAVGSAVKTASLMNVDNRIMYRMGVAARRLGLLDAEVVMGIPLSSTSKNIYFDRT